jgi:hypothetical protein
MPQMVDRTGNRYGRLTVIRRTQNKGRRVAWLCKCDCGHEVSVHGEALQSGGTGSCGCMARGVKDEVGKRYGRLAVIGRAPANPTRRQGAQWLCRCDCGKEIITRGSSLRSGASASCGCVSVEKLRAAVMLPEGIAAMRQILRRTKANATERKYEYAISESQLIIFMGQPCHYCGAGPGNVSRGKEYNGKFIYNGIDRVDNSRGYVIDNIVPCCKHCNIAKRDRTAAEFLAWVRRVYQHSVVREGG